MATQFVSYPAVMSGGGGGGGSVVWTDEAPVGAINNANVTFTLSTTPVDLGTLEVFVDGLLINRPADYTIAANVLTLAIAPNFGQTIWANYRST